MNDIIKLYIIIAIYKGLIKSEYKGTIVSEDNNIVLDAVNSVNSEVKRVITIAYSDNQATFKRYFWLSSLYRVIWINSWYWWLHRFRWIRNNEKQAFWTWIHLYVILRRIKNYGCKI